MAIDCDHPRPPLNLPTSTPPQLGWTIPSFLSNDPLEFRRQLLEALQGIYLEQSRRFTTPAVIPLHDVAYDIPPGSVVRGVANGQTINLLPPGLLTGAQSTQPTRFILDDVITPLTVTFLLGDGTTDSATLAVGGVYEFLPGSEGEGYRQPPGSSGPLGSGVTTDRLLGRDTAGTGEVEQIAVGGGVEFTGSLSIQRSALTGDVTASAGSNVLTLGQVVNVTHFQDVTGPVFVGRDEGTSGPMELMTVGEATAILDTFTDSLQGVVPASGGVAGTYLEADGTFTTPPDNDTTYTAGDGLNLVGLEFSVDAADIAGTGLTVSSNNLNVDFSSVTYTAGDGIDLVGLEFSVDVSDFDGAGLEDDGSNNLRIASSAAGAGLSGGGGSPLAVNAGDGLFINVDTLEVDVGDFDGTGLEDDGANNLRISSSAAGTGLSGGSGSALSVDSTQDANARVGVRVNSSGSTFTRRRINLIEGSNITISHSDDSGSEEVDVTITAASSAPTAGDGIDVVGTQVSADVSDFAGSGLLDEGSNNLAVGAGDGINVNANDVEVDVTDILGNGLIESSNNISVGAGDGINVNSNDVAVNASALTSSSIVNSGNNFQRAALTGEVTASQNSNSLSITRSTAFTWTGIHTWQARVSCEDRFHLNSTTNVSAGNNVTLGDANVARITSGTTMTGMVATASSQIVNLVNTTGSAVSVIKESGSSSASNRFGGSSSTIVIEPGNMLVCWYDGSSSRWRASCGTV